MFVCSQNTTALVTNWEDVNRYGYNLYGLVIPYVLGNVLALVAVSFSMISFWFHGVNPDKSFQDIVSAAGNPEIIHVVRNKKRSMSATTVDGQLVWQPGAEI